MVSLICPALSRRAKPTNLMVAKKMNDRLSLRLSPSLMWGIEIDPMVKIWSELYIPRHARDYTNINLVDGVASMLVDRNEPVVGTP